MGLFSKKDKGASGSGGGDDENRSGLFSKKDKNAQSSQNPYANAPATDPYSQAKQSAYNPPPPPAGLPSGPRPGGGGGLPSGPGANKQGRGYSSAGQDNSSSGYPNEKSPAVTGPGGRYGASSGGYGGRGYGGSNPYGGGGGGGGVGGNSNPYGGSGGSDRYGGNGASNPYGGSGNGGGYGQDGRSGGNDRYGSGAAEGGGSRYGAGGYGGMGASGGDEDDNRGALFGGAKERVQARQQQEGPGDNPPAYGQEGGSGAYGAGGGYGSSQGYGGATYDDRQLTAEEEEEQDVGAAKQQIRQMKQEDVSSTRNALRIAQQAEETGRDTLARLGAQGEMMHNTKKNLDLSNNQNRIAEERAKELKTLNRSMFAVHVSNPFTAGSRRSARDQAIEDKHLEEKGEREATRMAAYQTEQRMQRNFAELNKQNNQTAAKERNLAERAKYQFEADSEDEEMENEIDSNLDALGGAAGRLHNLAKVTGDEVDRQNKLLDEIHSKGDQVDLGLARNRAKIDRIR